MIISQFLLFTTVMQDDEPVFIKNTVIIQRSRVPCMQLSFNLYKNNAYIEKGKDEENTVKMLTFG